MLPGCSSHRCFPFDHGWLDLVTTHDVVDENDVLVPDYDDDDVGDGDDTLCHVHADANHL